MQEHVIQSIAPNIRTLTKQLSDIRVLLHACCELVLEKLLVRHCLLRLRLGLAEVSYGKLFRVCSVFLERVDDLAFGV